MPCRRRSTLAAFALLALSSAPPAFAQSWLQRYLSEHKQTSGSNGTQSQDQTDPATTGSDSAQVRRALPADGTAAPPIPSDSPPVARALPADGSEPPPIPASEGNASAAPSATPIMVRHALPVIHDQAAKPSPPEKSEDASAEPTPTPARVHPVATPKGDRPESAPAEATPTLARTHPTATPPAVVPVRSPRQPSLTVVPAKTPVPVATPPTAPAESAPTPAVVVRDSASPSPAATGTDETTDPDSVIRLSPGAAPLAPDVNQFRIAKELFDAKQFERAAPEFERYLSMFPQGADREAATFQLAESYRQIGSVNAAKRNYEALLFNFEHSVFTGTASYRLADICFEAKDWTEALTFYRKASVTAQDPLIVLGAKVSAAHCLDNLKMVEDAILAYEDVLATKEANLYREDSQLALVRLNIQAGKQEQAITLLTSLRSETRKDALKAQASVQIGLLLLNLNQNDKAIGELTRALKMPELGEWKEKAEVGLLAILFKQGKYQAVLDDYAASDKQFSATAMPEVLFIVANSNSNRQINKYEAAVALYDQLIRDYPDTTYAKDASYERLTALYYSADADKVAVEVKAYLAANPDEGSKRERLMLLMAESYYKANKFAEAALAYNALDFSALSPEFRADAQFKLGWCYAQTHQHDKAVKALSNFLSAYPDHKLAAKALAQRALNYQQLNQFPSALDDYNSLIERYPQSKERENALYQKGKIQGQLDEYDAMVESFTQLLKEFPKSLVAGEANYWVGWAAMKSKKYREAIPPLETARTLDKQFAEDHEATAFLLAAHKELEERDAEAAEVDRAVAGGKFKVPADYLHWLGGEYLKAGDAAKAEKYLKVLTSRGGGEDAVIDDWLNLGRVRNQLGKWAEAESALNTYLKGVADPIPQATGYLELGQAQLGMGQFDAAQQSADLVLEKQAEGTLNSKGRMLQGDILMKRGDFDGAAKEYLSISILCAEDPQITPESLDKAYKAYKAGGNEAQAAKVLNELQSKYPEYQLSPASVRKSLAKP